MTFSKHMLPPLSPVLVAGIALKVMPLSVLNPLLEKSMQVMIDRHRDVFERLSCLENVIFAIDPTDLPFVFILNPCLDAPRLKAVYSLDDVDVTASIHGSFTVLTKLLEGSVDGDALVFSRDLVIEGDTEAVLALRNAVDGGNIDIKQDLASAFGPLSIMASKAADGVINLAGRAGEDMALLQDALISRITQRTEAHSAQLEDIEEQIEDIQKKIKKFNKRSQRGD